MQSDGCQSDQNEVRSVWPVERPLILPGVFTRDGDFCEWYQRFESIAIVNLWDDISKLQWLHMCDTGRARVALTRAMCVSYKRTKEAL